MKGKITARSPLKLLLLFLIILSPLGLTGCLNNMVQVIDETLPRTRELDLAPYWVFESAHSLDPDNQDIDSDYFEDLGVYVSKDQIIIGTDILLEPDLKVMEIRTYDYFLTRYKITPREVGLLEETLKTYTVTDAKGFSVRIHKLSEERIALERNNILLYFDRTDELTDTGIHIRTDSQGLPQPRDSSDANGVLIGLRQDREEDEAGSLGAASYRTLWIAREKGQPLVIYEIPDILFPRNVFYQLKVERQENIDVVRETITIKNLQDGSVTREAAPAEELSRLTDITFISNDYFSAAARLVPDKTPGPLEQYSTRHVDQPNYENRIDITGLFGPEGISVMESAAQSALSNEDSSLTTQLEDLREDSYILRRYNGRWIYQGMINSREGDEGRSLAYPINFRDNYRVYHYDTLQPRWTEIVRTVPGAMDAVSSPGNLFTVVRTRTHLLIYARDEGQLAGAPMAQLPIEDEEIIMHEWALDSFVEEWTRTARLQGRPVDY